MLLTGAKKITPKRSTSNFLSHIKNRPNAIYVLRKRRRMEEVTRAVL